jgi:hypothetical protein
MTITNDTPTLARYQKIVIRTVSATKTMILDSMFDDIKKISF